jgi:hypothetical protein
VTKVTLDGGRSSFEKIDSRERVDVHRLSNVSEGGRLHLNQIIKMAGTEAGNVVFWRCPCTGEAL